MTRLETDFLPIMLRVSDREDGGIRVTSDEVPGLMLSGRDRQQVWDVIAPAVKRLLHANRGMDVISVFYPATAPSPPSPQQLTMHLEFVIGLKRAA